MEDGQRSSRDLSEVLGVAPLITDQSSGQAEWFQMIGLGIPSLGLLPHASRELCSIHAGQSSSFATQPRLKWLQVTPGPQLWQPQSVSLGDAHGYYFVSETKAWLSQSEWSRQKCAVGVELSLPLQIATG